MPSCPYFVWKSCDWGDELSFRAWHIPGYEIGSKLGMWQWDVKWSYKDSGKYLLHLKKECQKGQPACMWSPEMMQPPWFHLKDEANIWYIQRHKNLRAKKLDPLNYANSQVALPLDFLFEPMPIYFLIVWTCWVFWHFQIKTMLTKKYSNMVLFYCNWAYLVWLVFHLNRKFT